MTSKKGDQPVYLAESQSATTTNFSKTLLEKIATQVKSWVGDVPYDFTVIQIGDGSDGLFVRMGKNGPFLFDLSFLKITPDGPITVAAPDGLSGQFTSRRMIFETLQDYCEKGRVPFRYDYVTADGGTRLGVNPAAL